MLFEGINHRCGNTDCYALDKNELIINISTNKKITAVNLIHEDPYINGASGRRPWYGVRDAMHISIGIRRECDGLKSNYIEWKCGENRLIHYVRPGDIDIEVYINADNDSKMIELNDREIIYARGYSKHMLASGGNLILRRI